VKREVRNDLMERTFEFAVRVVRGWQEINWTIWGPSVLQFGRLRLSETTGVAVRSLPRAKPRDLDFAIEDRSKTPLKMRWRMLKLFLYSALEGVPFSSSRLACNAELIVATPKGII
jgi:hypothetical protein